MALQRLIKNFGSNVVYCFFGYHVGHKFDGTSGWYFFDKVDGNTGGDL